MYISRSKDDRLTGRVRVGDTPDLHEFSGTLELLRVFEDLVPPEQSGTEDDSAGRGDARL